MIDSTENETNPRQAPPETIKLRGEPDACLDCGASASAFHENVTTRHAKAGFSDTPEVVVACDFYRCACGSTWLTERQADWLNSRVRTATFHAYRAMLASARNATRRAETALVSVEAERDKWKQKAELYARVTVTREYGDPGRTLAFHWTLSEAVMHELGAERCVADTFEEAVTQFRNATEFK